jgi:hypothetical protein
MTEQPTDSGLQGASDANDLVIPQLDNAGVVAFRKGPNRGATGGPVIRYTGPRDAHQHGNLSDLRDCHTIERHLPR